MKKVKQMLAISLIMLFAITIGTHAQSSSGVIITYPAEAQNLTAGYGSSLLTVNITFTESCSTGAEVSIDFPENVEYLPGSITKVSGSLDIIESSLIDLNHPTFTVVGTISGSNDLTFTVERRALCATLSSGKDIVEVISCFDALEDDEEVNNYNILQPSLAMVGPAAISDANIGMEFTRTSTINNGGLGATDELYLYIVYPDAEMESSSPTHAITANGFSFNPTHTSGDTLFYTISGATIFSGNNLFENSENVTIVESVRLLKCATTANSTIYNVSYGYETSSEAMECSESSIIGGVITMSGSTPNLTVTLVTESPTSYCFVGENKIQTIRVRNTGTSSASQIQLFTSIQIPGSYTGNLYLDTVGGWVVRDSTGLILDTIRTFTGIATFAPGNSFEGADGGACVASPHKLITTTIGLGDVFITPGGYIDIDVNTKTRDFSCDGCAGTATTMLQFNPYSLRSQVLYKNQCGLGAYSSAFANLLQSYPVGELSRNIEAPTDIWAGDTFNYYYNSNFYANHLEAGGYLKIKINLAGTGFTTYLDSITILSNLPARKYAIERDGDDLLIGPILPGVQMNSATFTLPLVSDLTTCGTVTMSSSILIKFAACVPEIERSCNSSNIFIHCPMICDKGGAVPEKFNLKRVSLGIADLDNNEIPDGTGLAPATSVMDHRAVNGDTLQGEWNLKIYPNVDATDSNVGRDFQFVYIDFDLNNGRVASVLPGYNNTLTTIGDAQVEIYPVGSSTPIIGVITPTITGSKFAHYEIGPSIRGGDFQTDDSIVVKALFKVHTLAGTNRGGSGMSNSPTKETFKTQNKVYATYHSRSSHVTDYVEGFTYHCRDINDYSTFCSLLMINVISNNTTITGCTGTITGVVRYFTESSERIGDFFPNEFRQFAFSDEIWIAVPDGFNYRPSSNVLTFFNKPSNVVVNVPDANISQSGNLVKITGLKNYYSKYGGTILGRDEFNRINWSIQVDPTCEAVNGTDTASSNGVFVSDGSHWLESDHTNRLTTGAITIEGHRMDNTYITGYTVRMPELNLAGGGTVVSADGTATWTITAQNLSNNAPAANSWLYINPHINYDNYVVRQGSTIISPNSNGFYELGTAATSSSRTYTITADVNTCSVDSMKVNFGYNCGTYPTEFIESECNQFTWLKSTNPASQVQLSVLRHPGNGAPIDLCETDSVILLLNSAQMANLDLPYITFTPPAGMTPPTSVSIEYPYGSGSYQSIPVTMTGTLCTIDLTAHTNISTSGIKGTALANPAFTPAGGDRQAKIVIPINTDCNFTSGTSFRFRAYASRPCGGVALGNGSMTTTNRLYINGATSTGTASIDISLGGETSISCSTPLTVTTTATPLISGTQAGDTIIYTIPEGMRYADNFETTSGATVHTLTLIDGTELVKVTMPLVTTGTSINYAFDVTATGAGCDSNFIIAEYKRSVEGLSCGEVVCENSSVILTSVESDPIAILKPELEIVNVELSPSYSTGSPVIYDITIANNSTQVDASAGDYIIEFFCDSESVPFAIDTISTIVAMGSSVTETFSIVPSAPCTEGSVVTVKIQPLTNSGVNQCICASTEYIIGDPLPIDLAEFNAHVKDCQVAINWETTREEELSHYVIERSTDGRIFQAVSDKILGQGSYQPYLFLDKPTNNNTYFYRLLIVNNKGVGSYSMISRVEMVDCYESSIKLMPNPANSWVKVDGLKFGQTVSVYNTLGQLILTQDVEKDQTSINFDAHNWPPAPYFVVVMDKGQSVFKETLIKK